MVTEIVNGKLRQVFDFSKLGVTVKFYAPLSIGAGYRSKIEIAKATAMVDSPVVMKMTEQYFKKHPAPKGIPEVAWRKSQSDKLTPVLMEQVELNDYWKLNLITLECVLIAAPDSVSVEQWYMELADETETGEILNFIEPTSSGKTETAAGKTISGSDTRASEAPEV